MKRLLVVGTFISLVATLVAGCAAELSPPEEERDQALDYETALVDLGPQRDSTSSTDSHRIEAAARCHGCGPVPDPWKSITGPVPDPWDDPSSAHAPPAGGSSGRPGTGGQRRP